jgi:hypothetical protein
VIHRVETWSRGSGYRNGVSELNPFHGILGQSESPWIRFISTPGHPLVGRLAWRIRLFMIASMSPIPYRSVLPPGRL